MPLPHLNAPCGTTRLPLSVPVSCSPTQYTCPQPSHLFQTSMSKRVINLRKNRKGTAFLLLEFCPLPTSPKNRPLDLEARVQACPPIPEGALWPTETQPAGGSETSVARAGITADTPSYRDEQGHIYPPPDPTPCPAAHKPSIGKLSTNVASASKDERPLAPPETRAKYIPRQLAGA